MLDIARAFVGTTPNLESPILDDANEPRTLEPHETSTVVGAPEVQNEPEPD